MPVFQIPGRPPMHKDEFAAQAKAQARADAPEIDGTSEIQEITLADDWAFMRTRLRAVATPRAAGQPKRRPPLARWMRRRGPLAAGRDASLLAPLQRGPAASEPR